MADLGDRTDNVSLTKDDGTLPVDVITDAAGKNRLAVDTAIDSVLSGKLFSFAISIAMASNGVNNPLLFLKNPIGSGKTVRVHQLFFGIDVANVFGMFGVYVNPTTSANGTTQTPVNRLIGGSASSMNLYTGPTVSASGTLLGLYEVGQNTNSIGPVEDGNHIYVPANNTLLITGDPSSNNRAAVITLLWEEV